MCMLRRFRCFDNDEMINTGYKCVHTGWSDMLRSQRRAGFVRGFDNEDNGV